MLFVDSFINVFNSVQQETINQLYCNSIICCIDLVSLCFIGFTLLLVAAMNGNVDAVETLVKAGANVNHENEIGN